jgi:hypothetical protein
MLENATILYGGIWPGTALWRRGGDSNPRYGCPYAAFRVRCIQPLCHLSIAVEMYHEIDGEPAKSVAGLDCRKCREPLSQSGTVAKSTRQSKADISQRRSRAQASPGAAAAAAAPRARRGGRKATPPLRPRPLRNRLPPASAGRRRSIRRPAGAATEGAGREDRCAAARRCARTRL